MTTLANRATPRQAMVMRMIEGAVRNAAHAHPDYRLDDRIARGIAKRATGTITSQWRDVLAAPLAWSDGEDGETRNHHANGGSADGDRIARRPVIAGPSRVRGASHVLWRAPLHALHRALAHETGRATRSGQHERAAALIDVLRLIARMREAPLPPTPRDKLTVGKLP